METRSYKRKTNNGMNEREEKEGDVETAVKREEHWMNHRRLVFMKHIVVRQSGGIKVNFQLTPSAFCSVGLMIVKMNCKQGRSRDVLLLLFNERRRRRKE